MPAGTLAFGMGSITGAILGAAVMTLLPELLRQLPDVQMLGKVYKFTDLRLVIFAALLIVIMITRPQGILGTGEISLNWFRRKKKGGDR